MVMTDVSNSQERADALGKLGVSYGVGMVVGPTVGGYITMQYSEQFAAGVAALLCVVTMVIIVLLVPANTKTAAKAKETKENKKQGEGGGGGGYEEEGMIVCVLHGQAVCLIWGPSWPY